MSEIRIQKIDGQEFVTLTDYLRLKEEKQELEYLGDINEELKEENQKLNIIIENTKIEQKSDREYIEELEEENKKLKEENKKLKYVIDLAMEKAGIEYIRLADGDVFMNPKNKLHISDTIQVDILNGIKNKDESKQTD